LIKKEVSLQIDFLEGTHLFDEIKAEDDRIRRYPYLVWQYLHIVLAYNRSETRRKQYARKPTERRPSKNNKGKAFFIFDQLDEHESQLSELLYNRPSWLNDYFNDHVPEEYLLSEVCDTAYFIRSHHANIVQLADLVAFAIRRYAELFAKNDSERFEGEKDLIMEWYEILKPAFMGSQHVVRKTTKDAPLADFFREVRPSELMY
jgi:hypothetical protein